MKGFATLKWNKIIVYQYVDLNNSIRERKKQMEKRKTKGRYDDILDNTEQVMKYTGQKKRI